MEPISFQLAHYHYLDLVSEGLRGVAAGDGGRSDVPHGLQDGALAALSRGEPGKGIES